MEEVVEFDVLPLLLRSLTKVDVLRADSLIRPLVLGLVVVGLTFRVVLVVLVGTGP